MLYQYVALIGNTETIGISEDQYQEMKQGENKNFDERDRLSGEDMITYLNRKREA